MRMVCNIAIIAIILFNKKTNFQNREPEEEEEDDMKPESKGNNSITNFFKPKIDDDSGKIVKKQKIHSFFRDRNLAPIKGLSSL